MKRFLKRRVLPVATAAWLALFWATPALAQGAADQKSMFTTLLPLFVVAAIPVFIIVSIDNRDPRRIFKGLVVGVITFVVASVMVGVI